MARGELGSRVLVAAIGIPIAFGLIYLGGWALGVLMGVAAGLSASEYYSMAEAKGVRPLYLTGVIVAAGMPLLATAFPTYAAFAPWAFGVVMAVALYALAEAMWTRWPDDRPLGASAVTVTGILYAGMTLAFAALLRHLPETVDPDASAWHGTWLVVFPLWVTWWGDTAAYFAGTRWGRAKLFEAVSPKKTWVGSIAGVVASVVGAALFGSLALADVPGFGVGPATAALLGVPIGIVGQIGDLAESVLKREAGRKDSSNLLPGHGGALDRLDALFFTVPLTYGLLVLLA
ncbi:MAG: hypothetical protein D6701_14930 [Gemmatimonadetes bacterium]|nr:MAG: hypothetical protein D6701_14930 [Gemmatimonadota bacterium]